MMDQYLARSRSFEQTRDANDLVGLSVLTLSGRVLGRVRQVRLHHQSHAFEGIVVRRCMFSRSYFLCKEYIAKATADAVLLNMEPVSIYLGRDVVSSDGKVFGKVHEVRRISNTNELGSIIVSRSFFRRMVIPAGHIKKLGASIIIKQTYSKVCHGP